MGLLLRLTEMSEDGIIAERMVEVEQQLRVGRAAGNDLVLDDESRTLSKTHCVIQREASGYIIVDSSTNGIFVNGAQERLQLGEAAPLRAGDTIALGRYRLSVVSDTSSSERDRPGLMTGLLGPVAPMLPELQAQAPRPLSQGAPLSPVPPPRDSIDDLLGEEEALDWAAPAPIPSAQPDHVPALAQAFRSVAPSREVIPDDWDPMADLQSSLPVQGTSVPPSDFLATSFAPSAPPSASPPAMAPETLLPAERSPSGEGRAIVDQMLAACGVDAGRWNDAEAMQAAEQVGRLLNIAVDGLLRILGSRWAVKQAFHAERTAISQGANNPMKFTASAPEALRLMLRDDVPGFLPADQAMREAVEDIQSHQVTLLAAAQQATAAVLGRLAPEVLEALPSRGVAGALPLIRKAQAWDSFLAAYAQVRQGLNDEDGALFAEAFARAQASLRPGANTPAAPKGRPYDE